MNGEDDSADRKPSSNSQILLEKIELLKQNSKFLQYKKGINQDALNFVLHHNRDEWKISDTQYMKLLNYYLAQRAKITNQLHLNDKIVRLLELETLCVRLHCAQSTVSSLNTRCEAMLLTLHCIQ